MAITGDGASNVMKMAQKLQSLREEDQLVQRALNHRERVNQYKYISDIFDEFIAPGGEEDAENANSSSFDEEEGK